MANLSIINVFKSLNFSTSSRFELSIAASHEFQNSGHFLAYPQNFGISSFGSLIDTFSFRRVFFTSDCYVLTTFSKVASFNFALISNSLLSMIISSIRFSTFEISIISSSMVLTALIFLLKFS